MSGLPFQRWIETTFFAEGAFAAINWLWIAGGIAAVWLLVSAMGRRQVRLTGLLRDHVTKHVEKMQDANLPPETAAPTEETNS